MSASGRSSASRAGVSEDYLSQVTHELRGSLNAMVGWAEFLRTQPCDDAARVRAAETIIRHARQQSAMIVELIDTWRLVSGTLKFTSEAVDLWHCVEAAIDAVRPLAQARSVQLEPVTEAPPGVRVRGDGKRLTQALASLLSNSVNFSPERSVVTVQLDASPGVARLVVHDAGVAVPPAALPSLFDRNRPADSGRASPRSTFRLGLAFVRDVIAHHGGSIGAESGGSSEGMTFRVILPVDAVGEAVEGALAAPAEALTSGPPPRIAGLRVLLVDDEVDAREALMGILEHHGATVRSAASASEAIFALQHDPFDVLLADIGMPGADGYDLITYVRALDEAPVAHIPAMAVTAFASDADRRRVLDAGYQMHLSKPVDPVALVAAVAALGRPEVSIR